MFCSVTSDAYVVSSGLYVVKILELRGLRNRTKHEVQNAVSEMGTKRTFNNSLTYRKKILFAVET